MEEKLYNVGKIVNTHGIRGELKLVSQTDFPDIRFQNGSELILLGPSGEQLPVTVESGRPQKNVWMVKFKEFADINAAEKVKNWDVKVRGENLVDLEDGEYYYHEIIGCRVFTEEEEDLGTIKEILTPGANDVWIVKMPNGKELLLPYIDEVVLSVNVVDKRVTVRLMEGLL
ncbi:ribosome maturation factor RimM [Gorillibacterium timonense]|uniref:ribosome maturation factor RimM n=1 Tax=Gorillibacterium timonense TaxID=1689269 RepID=UPI00071C2E01|nr:ribosome maturation factor RimM [Gorillibacterium timonense]